MIGLNVLIWLLQTVSNGLALYQTWLAFIRDAVDPDQSLLVLEYVVEPSHTIVKIRSFFGSMMPVIADTVMASIAQLYTVDGSLSDALGMEMLGYLQPELEDSHDSLSHQCVLHWYVLVVSP
jgi:hypothetical protein